MTKRQRAEENLNVKGMSNIKDERTANVSLSFVKIIQFQLESVELENLTRDLSDFVKAEIGARSGNFHNFFLSKA